MLRSDNKASRRKLHSKVSQIKQSLNSRILKENSQQDKCLKVVEYDLSGNLLVTNLLNCIDLALNWHLFSQKLFWIKDIYHKKLQTDGIAELNKGSLNYSEKNKLGECSYGNVYHGDYEGMSVFVKQFKCNNLHKLFIEANVLRDLQTIRHNEHFPYFFAVSRCTLRYVLVTQLLFYRTADKS